MRHLLALAIKFVMVTAVLLLVLTVGFDVPFVDTLLISLALTALSYAMGDIMIFLNAGSPENQSTRNTVATFVDFVMAFLTIWLIGWLLTGQNFEMVTPALLSALVISGGEWFFHLYVDRSVVPEYNNYKAVKR
ncbi:hypothetical protein QOZ98_001663 [Planomicrobium stackebrandtii]|uniref:DUF2512 family protein n=1 Tax=Planomicrobium stackebrandtii TaxID=253160 RepID=A0ABU0GU00_9BACL|nr:DUF2512 family protein [Planomicrobium stackebrandtii]MDQ0428836.1 hypothetical protein [Planomicrobium stackebrandtii]